MNRDIILLDGIPIEGKIKSFKFDAQDNLQLFSFEKYIIEDGKYKIENDIALTETVIYEWEFPR